MAKKQKTHQEIVDNCNELAIRFYRSHGYQVPKTYKMYNATHPQEVGMWNLAVMAYEHIEGTEVDNVLDDIREDLQL